MRGQLFSIDLLVALSLFFLVLGLIFYIWTAFQIPRIKDVQEKALTVSEFLVSSKIGKEAILDCGKTSVLAAKSYDDIKTELSVRQYDIFVEFTNTTPICGGNQTNIGMTATNKNIVAAASRFVYFNLDKQNMTMVVRLYA